MVFDTTASNTGHKTAASVAVQRDLGKPLLWLACRHQVGKVLLTHVWNCFKIENSVGPTITIFSKLKQNWRNCSRIYA